MSTATSTSSRHTLGEAFVGRAEQIRRAAIFVLLGAQFLLFSLLLPNFLTAGNLQNIAVRAAPLAIVAAVMTLILLLGAIDVSVGSMLGVLAWVVGTLTVADLGVATVLAAVLLAGAAMGSVNGLIVGKGKVLPIVGTLGMLFVWRAVVYGLWDNSDVFAPPLLPVLTDRVAGIPVSLFVVAVVYAAVWYVLRFRPYGRHVYAVGNDAEAARLVGINVDRVIISTYALLGLAVAVASVFYMSRTGVVQAFTGEWFELGVIASVLIGGTRITGGRGSVIGTLGGVCFVATLENGIVLMGVPSLWNDFALGAMILIAVSADALISRRTAAKGAQG